jgi:hypothetical protein
MAIHRLGVGETWLYTYCELYIYGYTQTGSFTDMAIHRLLVGESWLYTDWELVRHGYTQTGSW